MLGRAMRRWLPILKWVWTLAIVIGAIFVFGHVELTDRLGRLSVQVVMAVLALSVLQVVLSAWRWQFTARQLGLAMSFRGALREYYMATFINQVLPGGVLGDANRALRHGAVTDRRSEAISAVMIERFSGQFVLALTTFLAWGWMPPVANAVDGQQPVSLALPSWLIGVVGLVIVCAAALLHGRLRRGLAAFGRALRPAFLNPAVFTVQLVSSALVVASYVLVFIVLAMGMGVAMPLATLVPCVLLLLISMTIPVTVAGWGVREGVAGALWVLAGYPAEEGLALSLAYGAVFLVSSLPGLPLVLPRVRSTD